MGYLKPKLDIKVPKVGIVFNIIALILFCFSVLFVIAQWSSLPDLVPSHYNALGEADSWSHKAFIFIPLGIGLFLWLGCHEIEKRPHLHNYTGLTEENIRKQYQNSMLLINFIKNELLLFLSYGGVNDVFVSHGKKSLLGIWELPIFAVMIGGTLLFFVIRSFKVKKG